MAELAPQVETKNFKARAWLWTWNNPTQEEEKAFTEWVQTADRWAWQGEAGEEAGTYHIQAATYFDKPRWRDALKKLWPRAWFKKVKATGPDWQRVQAYCNKSETCVKKGGTSLIKVEDPLDKKSPYSWQFGVMCMIISKPDDRSIYWYYEESGKFGKTVLAKHLLVKETDVCIVSGSKKDAACAIALWMKQTKRQPRVVIFIYGKDDTHVSYKALEAVKDGLLFSSKYESGTVVFNNPHVIVLANRAPDKSKLSKDRWRIKHLDDTDLQEAVDLADFIT